ncbi:MAG: response regulator, partial [bacterium]|nr:response regulator [bacterium]
NFEVLNLYSFFNEIEAVFAAKMASKNLEFITDIAPDIPSSLLLDEIRLRQILFNLIGNAVKFTDRGYINVSVRKVYACDDKSALDLVMAVEDTGIGIPPDSREDIFEAFRQQDGQDTKKYGGTGLGLAITKRLVEMMSGQISVKSEMGKGSTFEVILHDVPIAATMERKLTATDNDYKNIQFESALVLVVDDIEENRVLLREFLLTADLSVVEAENGIVAVQKAKEHNPDLILMDIKMPQMNGYEAARKIREQWGTLPIPMIAVTASAMVGEREKILSSGFAGFLHKPVQVDELFRELSLFLQHSQKQRISLPAIADEIKNGASQKPGDESENAAPRLSAETADNLSGIIESMEALMDVWKENCSKGFFNEITDFGNQIKDLGQKNDFALLEDYGDSLVNHANSFDIENMNETLKYYPHLIKKIAAIHQEIKDGRDDSI